MPGLGKTDTKSKSHDSLSSQESLRSPYLACLEGVRVPTLSRVIGYLSANYPVSASHQGPFIAGYQEILQLAITIASSLPPQ